jgi:hypothetical protein
MSSRHMSCPSGDGVGRAIALVADDALGTAEPVSAVAGELADGAVHAASVRANNAARMRTVRLTHATDV